MQKLPPVGLEQSTFQADYNPFSERAASGRCTDPPELPGPDARERPGAPDCEPVCFDDLEETGIIDGLSQNERRAVAAIWKHIHGTQWIKHDELLWSDARYADFARAMGGADKPAVRLGVQQALDRKILTRVKHPHHKQRFLYRAASELPSPRDADSVKQGRLFGAIDPPRKGTAASQAAAPRPVGSPDPSELLADAEMQSTQPELLRAE
jgi:hypothetical protein